MCASLVRPCTRICAKMSWFLLVIREYDLVRDKVRFSLVNRLFFETRRNVLKAVISKS